MEAFRNIISHNFIYIYFFNVTILICINILKTPCHSIRVCAYYFIYTYIGEKLINNKNVTINLYLWF